MNRLYIIAGLVILVLLQAFFYQRLDNKFDEYKLEAQIEVKTAENKALVAETTFYKSLDGAKNDIQKKYDAQTLRIDTVVRNLSNVRLRDPGISGSNQATGSTTGASGNERGTQPTVLSAEASQFLWSFAGDADRERESLIACKQWSKDLKEAYDNYRLEVEGK